MNSQQQIAVESTEGRILILAGAGSGKTRVLTHRMAHLIRLGVKPSAILGLTFTNRAAVEMRHRMAALIPQNLANEVTLSTFHSFCLQILRNDIEKLGYTSQFSLYTEHDVKRLMNYITRDILNQDGDLPSFAKAESLIQKAKSQGKRPHELEDSSSRWHETYTRTLFERLENAMQAYNAVDFDHLLTLTVRLFETYPEILNAYQERFRYIMVDEYQDTNPVQYRLVELLSAKYSNLCVVGDDDQSIYGWRGANMRNILEFENAKVIKLEQNYRSTNVILEVANAIIRRNTERHQKVLWSECGRGDPVEVFVARSEMEEAHNVALRIVALRDKEKLKWRDIAILYRSNSLSKQMELALMKQSWFDGAKWHLGVPYEIHGSTEWYEKREVKDLQAYLRLIVNRLDLEATLRIINQPRRGIGESTLNKLTAHHRNHQIPLWEVIEGVSNEGDAFAQIREELPTKAFKALQDFVMIIKEAENRFSTSESLSKAFEWLIERIDYKRAIREEVKSEQMRSFKWQNVLEFVRVLSEYETLQNAEGNRFSQLVNFVAQLPMDGCDAKNFQGDELQDKVQLMTFHSSKGLEFPACFLIGIEDHIIPHEKSLIENGVEEERRLMYVAVTRAMHHLIISMAAKRDYRGEKKVVKPSRFLFDIPKELIITTQSRNN